MGRRHLFAVLAIVFVSALAFAQSEKVSIRQSQNPGHRDVSVESKQGSFYLLETSSDLIDWRGVAGTDGTGSNLICTVDIGEQERMFFRFVIEENGVLRGLANIAFEAHSGFSESGRLAALILSSNGVSNTDDLFNRFRSVYRVNLEVAKLQQAGLRIDEGNVIGLLREAELRTSLKPLEALGFRATLTDALVKSRFNMTDLHRFMRRLPANPGDLMARDAYVEFKNTLSEAGDAQASVAEFHRLREYVAALNPLPDLRITQSYQDAKDGVFAGAKEEPVSSMEEKLAKMPPPNYGYFPAYAKRHTQALLMRQSYPIAILGYGMDTSGPIPMPVEIGVHPPFTEESENAGYRNFLINESGLAWFKAYGHAQGGRLLIRNQSGQVIIDAQIPANTTRGFIIPIFNEDVCAPFEVLKGGGLTLSLVDLQKPLAVENDGNRFSVRDQPLAQVLHSSPAGAAWLRFSMLDNPGADGQQLSASLQVRNNSIAEGAYHVSLLRPDRTYSSNSVSLNRETVLRLESKNGLWDLFILPPGLEAPLFTFNPNTGKLASISLFSIDTSHDSGEPAFDFELQYEPVRTRPFILGKVNKIGYSRDGESTGNFGEVKISFHANIAPYFEKAAHFATVFGESPEYNAWSLWMDNNKNASNLSRDSQFAVGIAKIRANEAFLSEYKALFREFFPSGNSRFSFHNDDDLLTVYSYHIRNELGKSWYRNIGDAQTLYQTWAENVVQINAFKYPFGQKYKLMDTVLSGLTPGGALELRTLHPVIPVDIPVFAFPKDRMARETLPISFDYCTWEEDELDKGDLFGAAIKGVVNVGLAVFGQNWAKAVCSGVDMVDEMHKTIEAAKDDPIGAANFRMNRASSSHGFYGLEDDDMKSFNISGKPRKNGINAFENGLNYAKLACDTLAATSSIGGRVESLKNSLTVAWDILSSGNLAELDNLKAVLLLAAGDNADKIALVGQFIAKLKAGQLADNFEITLEMAELSEDLTSGTDLFDTFASLAENLKGMSGMGSLGFNLVHSECYFHFNGYDERKTTANTSVGIVRSVPAKSIAVKLDKVDVLDIKEAGLALPAEIFINSRVGIIADQAPTSWANVELQYTGEDRQLILDNGGKGFATCPGIPYIAYAKRSFPKIDFMTQGQYAPWTTVDNTLIEASWSSNVNTAAIYVELGAYENDGDNIDDDMIGVYSRTFLLEDILKFPGVDWRQTDASHWRLEVKEFPVFDAANLETMVELPEGEMKARQQAHNNERLSHPSALVSFHIDIEMGDFTAWQDENKYDLQTEDSMRSLTNINLRVVGASVQMAKEVIDLKNGRALAHLESESDEFQLGCFDINPANNATAIQARCVLPVAGMSAEVKSWFGRSQFLWAQLARNGDFVVLAHAGGLASFDVRNPDSIRETSLPFEGAMYPSRMAIDADGERVYVSFRKTGLDLAVYRLDANGAFTLVTVKNDINHTVAGLIPLPEGGVIVHSVSGIRNDSGGYALLPTESQESYFSDKDDIQDAGGDRFGNYNGLMALVWRDGALKPNSFIDLSGELSESQMGRVRLRNQSSMFRPFNKNTLISSGARPFAIGWNTALFFENPDWINDKDLEFKRYWETDLRGIDAGSCYVSGAINTRINTAYARAYAEDENALSPFNACTRSEGPKTCPDNIIVGTDLFLFQAGAKSYILTLGEKTTVKEARNRSLFASAPLVLVDLNGAGATRRLDPAYSGMAPLDLGNYVDSYSFLGNSNLAVVGGHDTMSGGNDLHVVDLSNPANPHTAANFGGEYYNAYDLLYVDSKKILFAINAYTDKVDVYDLRNPLVPQMTATLAPITTARTLAWSEKRQQLYVAGIFGSISVFTLNATGQFDGYREILSGVGSIKKLAYNDNLDVAIASTAPYSFINTEGAHELLVLDFQNAGDTGKASGRVAIAGRWTHPQAFGQYTSLDQIALAPDSKTAYAVIRNNNRYSDLYRFNLANRAAPAVIDAIYHSTDIVPLIGGIGMSPDGRYLACARNGLDIFDLQNQANSWLEATTHLNDPDGFHPYGAIEFSLDGDYILTGRVGYSNHLLRIDLFK